MDWTCDKKVLISGGDDGVIKVGFLRRFGAVAVE